MAKLKKKDKIYTLISGRKLIEIAKFGAKSTFDHVLVVI
jgi:hypothetical protein